MEIVKQPKSGKVEVIEENGKPKIKYYPDPDVNNEEVEFEYKITDTLGNSDTAKVKLKIECGSSQKKDSGEFLIGYGAMFSILLIFFMYRKENKGEIE
jgi:hypothetical protein